MTFFKMSVLRSNCLHCFHPIVKEKEENVKKINHTKQPPSFTTLNTAHTHRRILLLNIDTSILHDLRKLQQIRRAPVCNLCRLKNNSIQSIRNFTIASSKPIAILRFYVQQQKRESIYHTVERTISPSKAQVKGA